MRPWQKLIFGVIVTGLSGIGYTPVARAADYLIIDLSGGPSAIQYPVSYTNAPPAGGWTDAHKTTTLVMRRIPAGTFMMGSPEDELGRQIDETQREATLTQDYYIGVFQVTQKQWERVMGTWPSFFNNTAYRDARPVEQVSYYEVRENPNNSAISPNWPDSSQAHAESFMGKLRAKTGLSTLDLPTEAQWEHASRAGTTTALNSGENLTSTNACPNMSAVGRYYYNGGSSYTQDGSTAVGTARVGSYEPNDWGLYDMHGNVFEWTLNWYDTNTVAMIDPVGADSGVYRVARGGSWYSAASRCRSAYLSGAWPNSRYELRGFRLSRTLPADQYALAVANGTGGGTYVAGTTVAVTADAAPVGHAFEGWLIDPLDTDLGDDFDASATATTVTMPAHAVTLTAQWLQYTYPTGDVVVENRRPTFFWLSVEGATWYQLWINHNGQTYSIPWIQGATTWTPPTNGLPSGSYRWWVRGWGPHMGYGAWSGRADFTIPTLTPGLLSLLAPTGEQAVHNLTFRWNKDARATWYRLWVSRPGGGIWHDRWYAMTGTDEGTATLNGHPGGTSTWWIRGWGPDGNGPWSGPMAFETPDPAPAVPTLVTPIGATTSPVTLHYESARAEWYRVYVTQGNAVVLDQWTKDTTVDLGARPSGNHSWWVGAWNTATRQTVWSLRADFQIP